MWITVDVERALYVDRGRNVILCELMPGHQTLVLKLKGIEMTASSKCWICGEEEPHTHSQDEVERARVRDAYADIIEPFVKSNYVMDETSRWEAKRIADALISGGLARQGASVNAAPSQLDLDNMRDAAAGVRYRSTLESIADWRNVNISGEHELGLRDIIQSMIDSAVAALESPRSAGNASAWRVWWVSLNTSRSELFEDHDKATDKARETGGCVIPLYASQPSPAAPVETKHKPDMCPTCGINRDSPFPCEHPRSSSTTEGAAIEFEYTNWEGRKGIRQAIPLSIRFGKSEWHGVPQWLMLAYDIDKRAEREYAMADMQFEDGFLPGIDLAPNEPQQPEHLAPGGFCRYCGLQGGHSRMCQMAKHHG